MSRPSARIALLILTILGIASLSASAQQAGPIPSEKEVADLLVREPITVQSWPAWRDRLRTWFGDKGKATDKAFDEARRFLRKEASAPGELPAMYAKDAVAYYLLGNAYMYGERDRAQAPELPEAEKAYRRSIDIDPKIANAHRNLARTLIGKERQFRVPGMKAPAGTSPVIAEARREVDEARRLDPQLPFLNAVEGELAMAEQRYAQAEQAFRQAMLEAPEYAEGFAFPTAFAIVANEHFKGSRRTAVKALIDQYPKNGELACLYAVALATEGDMRAAKNELQRARTLGAEPDKVLTPKLVSDIETRGELRGIDAVAAHAPPGLLERFLQVMLYFAGFYAAVMALMALVGVALAGRTRGTGALQLLGTQSDELVTAGQVLRTQHESTLAKLYALGLFAGLILFYIAIPFILAGLLALTGAALYAVLMLGRIPVKLVLIVIVIGGGMAWAVLKSIFAKPGRGLGLVKKPEECPKLYAVINDVARRVDTDAVHELYLAPGSSIGVHQEGRGPFGIFGVKRRVLTLGLSTMHYLTVTELQAILAHEYAHFSHQDTFYSRFIYQVQITIGEALDGMFAAGGRLNFVNPFYWFLWLYYKAYSLLSSGFSRSREFLADRMAVTLYGSDVFVCALSKVATDGSLFEMTMYDHVQSLLNEDKAFVNMYAAFRDLRDQAIKPEAREELYQKILNEKGSLFASHPTFKERVEAVAGMPKASHLDTTSALQLFEDPDKIETELTDYMTGFFHYVRQLQAQAAAQAQQG
jgi:Zn-dependent protease with chaperone function